MSSQVGARERRDSKRPIAVTVRNDGKMKLPKFYVCILILVFFHKSANALCLDGRTPSVQEEARSSAAVITGVLERERNLSEDKADPDGVTATLYTVKVVSQLKGKVRNVVSIRSENTSSRFPLDANIQYLLFLKTDGGDFFIDSCGNSGALSTHLNAAAEVQQMVSSSAR
jgi:hypothetical protein